ncbi:MAG: hypothetical protein AAGB06_00415, partial [Verrucomicrobiota bacterium]
IFMQFVTGWDRIFTEGHFTHPLKLSLSLRSGGLAGSACRSFDFLMAHGAIVALMTPGRF